MNELIDFLDTHPEVKPLVTGEFLELIARTPGMAEVIVPCLKNVSDELREKLAERIQRSVTAEGE
jgi:predicted protein tyrosine phosphatase